VELDDNCVIRVQSVTVQLTGNVQRVSSVTALAGVVGDAATTQSVSAIPAGDGTAVLTFNPAIAFSNANKVGVTFSLVSDTTTANLALAGFAGEGIPGFLTMLLLLNLIVARLLGRRAGILLPVLFLALVHLSCGGGHHSAKGSVAVGLVGVAATDQNTVVPVVGLPMDMGSVTTP